MRVVIHGYQLPGLICGPNKNVHVGLQVKDDPVELVPADADQAEWSVEISERDGDFRGPAVHGKKGERFVYLTWGSVENGSFTMFRRAKLMLSDLPTGADRVHVDVQLTDEHGMPRCARLRPPAITIR